MKPTLSTQPLATMISRLVSGRLEARDAVRLGELLKNSKAARDYYRFYLARRWIHVVQTYDGRVLRLFVDGELVNETPEVKPFQGSVLRPVIGVLRPTQDETRRQWIGGIDEVSLYDRVLTPEKIQAQFLALNR